MILQTVSWTLYFTALGAGIISFISPCNLALLPAFFSYVMSTAKSRRESLVLSLLYSIGFAVTFAIIGVIYMAGILTLDNRVRFNLFAGIITIILALYVFFNKEISRGIRHWKNKRAQKLIQVTTMSEVAENKPSSLESSTGESTPQTNPQSTMTKYSGYGGAFLLGFSTGSSWIACVTPVFGTILAIGSVQGNYSTALYLMIIYGIGIMLPFILIGTIIGEINTRLLAKMIKVGAKLERIFALLLLWIGVEILLSAYNIPGLLEAF